MHHQSIDFVALDKTIIPANNAAYSQWERDFERIHDAEIRSKTNARYKSLRTDKPLPPLPLQVNSQHRKGQQQMLTPPTARTAWDRRAQEVAERKQNEHRMQIKSKKMSGEVDRTCCCMM